MSIKHWPRAERPREKLLNRGPQSLSDAELLAIFLGSGSRGSDAVQLARQILAARGGLRGVLQEHLAGTRDCHGVGPARQALLLAALELGHRYLEARVADRPVLHCPADTRNLVRIWLGHYQHEVFACLFLDNRHRVICREELFQGTIDGASVYPREVLKRALRHNAAALILAHNHPSGVAEPSQADRHITGKLRDALALVDIRVLDHLIVGAGETVSMAELGLL